ncbi:MAG: M20/M25/M40 family metallo-hydrolase [Caldilineaceae bacterium]
MLPNDYADVAAAAAALSQERDRVAAICVAVQQIAAPTDHEEERAAWVRARLDALGLSDVHVDAHRNVHARVPGRDATAPALLVSAHTDTVFPAHTDLSVRHDAAEEHIYGPGISDNSTGVAALLVLAETLATLQPPPVDIWLVANSGEEGLATCAACALRSRRCATASAPPSCWKGWAWAASSTARWDHAATVSASTHRAAAVGRPARPTVHVLSLIAADIVRIKVPTACAPRSTSGAWTAAPPSTPSPSRDAGAGHAQRDPRRWNTWWPT